jgi:hypothetical protein
LRRIIGENIVKNNNKAHDNKIMSEYLSKTKIAELLKIKEDGLLYHRESQTLEFKESFNFAGLGDYLRDFAAFANNKGGYLIFGVKDKPKREIIGLKERSYEQFDKIDPEKITGNILSIFSCDIQWEHEVFKIKSFNIGAFYIHEAKTKPVICKKDEGKDQILKNGEIYYRYGGRTQKIQYAELENLINERLNHYRKEWMDLIGKIAKAGPENAAILNTEKGIIEKDGSQILVLDEKLVKDLQWIKEGSFKEKVGEKTLKLVGEVQPVNKVEIIRKIKEDKLKEYPLSAMDLANEIKKEFPIISKNIVWEIIREHDLKNNKLYSDYVFRNKKQETQYKETGILPQNTPSIYNEKAIEYIIKVYKTENI